MKLEVNQKYLLRFPLSQMKTLSYFISNNFISSSGSKNPKTAYQNQIVILVGLREQLPSLRDDPKWPSKLSCIVRRADHSAKALAWGVKSEWLHPLPCRCPTQTIMWKGCQCGGS